MQLEQKLKQFQGHKETSKLQDKNLSCTVSFSLERLSQGPFNFDKTLQPFENIKQTKSLIFKCIVFGFHMRLPLSGIMFI